MSLSTLKVTITLCHLQIALMLKIIFETDVHHKDLYFLLMYPQGRLLYTDFHIHLIKLFVTRNHIFDHVWLKCEHENNDFSLHRSIVSI